MGAALLSFYLHGQVHSRNSKPRPKERLSALDGDVGSTYFSSQGFSFYVLELELTSFSLKGRINILRHAGPLGFAVTYSSACFVLF